MGRPRNFSREEVLEKAIPLFWTKGFSETSLQDLEQATGVNKSGLYSEFAGKEDIFVESLKYYLGSRGGREMLQAEPLGWHNIENFLKIGLNCPTGQKGCFGVNSLRELAILPTAAQEILSNSNTVIKRMLAKNIEAVNPEMQADTTAELLMTFFNGVCLEQNLKHSKAALVRKVDNMLKMVRGL